MVGVGATGLVGEEWRWRKIALLKSFQRSSMMAHERLCQTLEQAADQSETVAVDVLTTRAAACVVLYFCLEEI
jgi:hypothetical protein